MQIPDIYALEQLSDDEFWDMAFARAFPSSLSTPSAHSTSNGASPEQQQLSPSSERYVVCDDMYAFPLHALYEIIPVPRYTSFLPDTPTWMAGMIAWRGRIIATIDLHAFLHHTERERHGPDNHSLLIAHYEDTILAFSAAVEQTIDLDASDTIHTPLDIALLFKDVVQHLERTTTHE